MGALTFEQQLLDDAVEAIQTIKRRLESSASPSTERVPADIEAVIALLDQVLQLVRAD